MFGNLQTQFPPITKWWTISIVAITVLSSLGIIQAASLLYFFPFVWYKLEIWRIVTSFLYLGPPSFSFLMGILFFFASVGRAETMFFELYDFVYMSIIFAGFLLFIASFIPLGILAPGFSFACLYYYCRKNPNGVQSVYGIFTVPTKYFPWISLVISLLMGGLPIVQFFGLLVAHFYFVMKTYYPNYIQTPNFLKQLFPSRNFRVREDNLRQNIPQNDPFPWGHGQRLGENFNN
ncbi:der1-like protein derlin [Anaeramoeba ignava]|uniref:Derlin n=1 Tax=Anaeramoeba ignava TaxID=1746090 RepID=A0A9Q0L8A0_ANAIG|nr:der1-like protein derlin [Anaeramoeba ignava]